VPAAGRRLPRPGRLDRHLAMSASWPGAGPGRRPRPAARGPRRIEGGLRPPDRHRTGELGTMTVATRPANAGRRRRRRYADRVAWRGARSTETAAA
jgi:hypothetical protein